VYVRRGYLRDNRDIAKRFLKAYAEAVHLIKTDRESALKVFSRRMRLEDRKLLDDTYDYYAPRFSFPPRIDLQGSKDTLEFYAETSPELQGRKPEEFVYNSIIDELEREGFFKALGS
jgi:ABC-type nitrate/sulfonate/bicarbonate transport system substrate-binding protein